MATISGCGNCMDSLQTPLLGKIPGFTVKAKLYYLLSNDNPNIMYQVARCCEVIFRLQKLYHKYMIIRNILNYVYMIGVITSIIKHMNTNFHFHRQQTSETSTRWLH